MSRKPRKRKRRPGEAQQKQPQGTPKPPVQKPLISALDEQQQRDYAHTPVAQQHKQERKIMTYFEIIYLVLTAGLLATTVVLACFASDQLRSIRSQIELSQGQLEQARIEQRAWLGVTTPQISELIAGRGIDCVIPVNNTGHTPGSVTKVICVPAIIPPGDMPAISATLVNAMARHLPPQVESVIAPGGNTRFITKSTEIVTQETIAKIQSPNPPLALWIFGIICYRDNTNHDRETQFCFLYDSTTKTLLNYERFNYMK